MQPGSMTVIVAAQADLPRQAVEGASYIGTIEPVAGSGNEEANGVAATQQAGAARLIAGQYITCRGVYRNQPRLAKFGAAHCEHPGAEIDIIESQTQ